MKSILIAIPNIGNIRSELCEWLMRLGQQKDIVYRILFSNHKPHDNNRNHIANEFIKSGMDYLLMIDSDIVPITNVLEMVHKDKDVISSFIQTHKEEGTLPLAMKKVDGGYQVYKELTRGLNKVDATGTGCMMIRKNVFEKLDKPYFRFQYNDEGILTNGEDFNFCDKVNEAGMSVYFDTDHRCLHFQTIPF
jgi:hypothetical protein